MKELVVFDKDELYSKMQKMMEDCETYFMGDSTINSMNIFWLKEWVKEHFDITL